MGEEAIAIECARVVRQIILVRELARVHEDRGDDDVTARLRRAKERHVTVVQSAHGGHQADPFPGPAFLRGELSPGGEVDELAH